MLWGTTKKEKQKSAYLAYLVDAVNLCGQDRMAKIIAERQDCSIDLAKRMVQEFLAEAVEKGITAEDCLSYVLDTNDVSKNVTIMVPCPNCSSEKRVSLETQLYRCDHCGLEKALSLKIKRI